MVKKKNELYADQDEKWQHEIEMLERRVKSNFIDIDLGDGDSIAIRACLSEEETRKLAKLNQERLKHDPEQEEAKLNEIGYEILELITVNPRFTKQYFQDNRDKYGTEDLLKAFFGYYEQMDQRAQKMVQRAQKISEGLKKETEN